VGAGGVGAPGCLLRTAQWTRASHDASLGDRCRRLRMVGLVVLVVCCGSDDFLVRCGLISSVFGREGFRCV
jgi:hypothetical protein